MNQTAHFTIDSHNKIFLADGKPFFYLADTCWIAISLCPEEDFEQYCAKRAEQGFNVIQMSVLPLDGRPDILHPFEMENGHYCYDKPNEAYFEKANRLFDIASKYGIVPCLHLFWNSFVPDDWGTEHPVPEDQLESVTNYLLRRLKARTPFWSVSGDTRFETGRLVNFYLTVLNVMQKEIPDALVTFHLNPPYFPPKVLLEHPMYNFHSYQSGHEDGVFLTWIPGLSNDFLKLKASKPLINNEMCYEQIGRYKNKDHPFQPGDVRQAIWLSLLSGASAGFTYGAHGIWQTRQPNGPMSGEECWGPSVTMMEALQFEGAEDAAFAKRVFETENLFGLQPMETVFSHYEEDGTPTRGSDLIRATATVNGRVITFYTGESSQQLFVEEGMTVYNLESKQKALPGEALKLDRLVIQ